MAVPTFNAAGTSTATYSDVDLDQSGVFVFGLLDRFLGPAYAGPAAEIDPDAAARVVVAREQIASGYASHQLAWLFPGQEQATPQPDDHLAAAVDVLTGSIQDSLDSAYAIDAVVQLPVTWTDPDAGQGTDGITLYGTVTDRSGGTGASAADGTDVTSFGSTPARVPLDDSATGTPSSLLTFPFATQAEDVSSVATILVSYLITHVETTDAATTEGGRPSWYRLVHPVDVPVGGAGSAAAIEVPLVLRQFPTPPTLVSQQARPSTGTGLSGMLGWEYDYQFQAKFAAQDQVETTVTHVNPAVSATGPARLVSSAQAALSLPERCSSPATTRSPRSSTHCRPPPPHRPATSPRRSPTSPTSQRP